MDYSLRVGNLRVSLKGVERIEEDVDYNPYRLEGILGFALRGERVVPVIDGAEVLGRRGRKALFLFTGRSVVRLEYDEIVKEGGEVGVEEIERGALERLGGV